MARNPKTIAFWRGRLPHWEVEEGRYFVTLHLAGAIPHQGHTRIQAILHELNRIDNHASRDWLHIHRAVFREMEDWLDRAAARHDLRDAVTAGLVVAAIRHYSQLGYWNVFEFVVMPSHIHLFCELGRRGLRTTLRNFKRYTGRQCAQSCGRSGQSFWQREWFDHWSRSVEQDEQIVQYIRDNPVKAGLVADYQDWPYGSWNNPQ